MMHGNSSTILAAVLLLASAPLPALDWQGLWLNDDQRGAKAMQQQDYAVAAERFDDPRWQAAAWYRAGEYRRAAEAWAGMDDVQAHYNRGNALARTGDIDAAIAAYESVLARAPDHTDARHNLELLRDLAEEQDSPASPDPQAGQEPTGDPQAGGDRQDSAGEGSPGQQRDRRDGDPEPAAEGGERADTGGTEPGPDAPPGSDEAAPQEEDAGGRVAGQRPADAEPPEAQAAMEQWLRRVPDDPGGLLRRKFLYQYNRREHGGDAAGEPW